MNTYNGKPCVHGHGTLRYKAGGACVECAKALADKYGLTLEAYNAMLKGQNGICAICEGDNHGRTFSVDHDHKIGNVRALLCHQCNQGLGQFQDDPQLLQAAAVYLNCHGRM